MNNEFWLPVLTDGLFAAIAAIGFAVISNPPKPYWELSAMPVVSTYYITPR